MTERDLDSYAELARLLLARARQRTGWLARLRRWLLRGNSHRCGHF